MIIYAVNHCDKRGIRPEGIKADKQAVSQRLLSCFYRIAVYGAVLVGMLFAMHAQALPRVDAAGDLTNKIVLSVPASPTGMAPDLSMSYNSGNNVNGIAGVGWALSGLSMVQRTGDPLKAYSLDDQFWLDGSPLIVGDALSSSRRFYQRNDDPGKRVIFHNPNQSSSSYWRVETLDGTILVYGRYDSSDSVSDDNSKITNTEGKDADIWLLSYISDRRGNNVVYTYKVGNDGQYLLDVIYYNNSHSGGATSLDDYRTLIRFGYEDRDDQQQRYNPYAFTQSQRLSVIRTYTRDSTGTESLYSQYNLDYSYSDVTNRSLLTSIQREDSEGNLLPKETFTYASEGVEATFGYSTADITASGVDTAHWNENVGLYGAAGDFNGDGIIDFAGPSGDDSYAVLFPTADGTFTLNTAIDNNMTDQKVGDPDKNHVFAGDFNGDGVSDLIAQKEEKGSSHKHPLEMFYGSSDGSFSDAYYDYSVDDDLEALLYGNKSQWVIADFTGDGISDLLIQPKTADDGNTMYLLLGDMTKENVFTTVYAINNSQGIAIDADTYRFYPMDFNGDGRSDLLLQPIEDKSEIWRVWFSVGDGTFIEREVTDSLNYPYEHYRLYSGDYNGDGINDILMQCQHHSGFATCGSESVKLWLGTNTFDDDDHYLFSVTLLGGDTALYGGSCVIDKTDDYIEAWEGHIAVVEGHYYTASDDTAAYISGDFMGDGISDFVLGEGRPLSIDDDYQEWCQSGTNYHKLYRADGLGGFTKSSFDYLNANGKGLGIPTYYSIAGDLSANGKRSILDFGSSYDSDKFGDAYLYQLTDAANGGRLDTTDELISTSNGYGGTTTVTYQRAVDFSGAITPSSSSPWGNLIVADTSPRLLVKSATLTPGFGGASSSTDYDYQDGRLYIHNLLNYSKKMGFSQTTRHGDNGLDIVTSYSQDESTAGIITQVQKQINGSVVKQWDNSYSSNRNQGSDNDSNIGYYQVKLDKTSIKDSFDSGSLTRSYSYDELGQVISQKDVDSTTSTTFRRTTTTEYAYQSDEKFTWLGVPCRIKVYDGKTGEMQSQTSLGYDGQEECSLSGRGELTSIINRFDHTSNATTTADHNGLGLVSKVTDPLGNSTTYSYDNDWGFLLSTKTNALGQSVSYQYDDLMRSSAVIDNDNSITMTMTRYDGFNRIKSVIDVGDSEDYPTLSYSYYNVDGDSPAHTVSQSRLQAGDNTTADSVTYYDGLGRPLSVQKGGETQEEDGSQTTLYRVVDMAYSQGESTEQGTKESIVTTTMPYYSGTMDYSPTFANELNTAKQWTSTLNGSIQSETDAADNTHMVANQGATTYRYSNGNIVSQFVSDSFGQVTSRVVEGSAAGGTLSWTYGYNATGHLTSVEDVKGNKEQFSYDYAGRLLQLDSLGLGRIQYTYDKNNHVTKKTDARGVQTQYSYDALNRLLTVTSVTPATEEDGDSVTQLEASYGYDAGDNDYYNVGKLTRVSYYKQSYYDQFNYDKRGRLAQKRRYMDGNSWQFGYVYNSADQLINSIDPASEAREYSYDVWGNTNKVVAGGENITSNGHDEQGRPTLQHLGNGLDVNYSWYDSSAGAGFNLLAGIETAAADSTDAAADSTESGFNQQYQFSYDGDRSLLSSRSRNLKVGDTSLSQSATYTYNDSGQLAAGVFSDQGSKSYGYDELNNLLTKSSRTYSYEDNEHPHRPSKLTSVNGDFIAEYDASGNLNKLSNGSVQQSTYGWDYANRLVSLEQTCMAGNGLCTSSTMTAVYDPSGERVKKVEDGVTTYYVSDDYREQWQDGSLQSTRKYYMGNGMRDIIGSDNSVDGDLYWLHTDQQGSLSAVSDASGNMIYHNSYLPFGEDYDTDESQLTMELNYTGQRQDNSGLLYYHARYYDPLWGRFLSADPFLDQLDPNRYAYVGNDPVNFIDPSGNTSIADFVQNMNNAMDLVNFAEITYFSITGSGFSPEVKVALQTTAEIMAFAGIVVPIVAIDMVMAAEAGMVSRAGLESERLPSMTNTNKTAGMLFHLDHQDYTLPDSFAYYTDQSSASRDLLSLSSDLSSGSRDRLASVPNKVPPDILEGVGPLRPSARQLLQNEDILIDSSHGLQSSQNKVFADVVEGVRSDSDRSNNSNTYLWTIDERGVNTAIESTEWPTPRGNIVHSNISNEASIAGEAWFGPNNTVTINAGSGRFGDGAGITTNQWDSAIKYWENLGYNVNPVPFGQR